MCVYIYIYIYIYNIDMYVISHLSSPLMMTAPVRSPLPLALSSHSLLPGVFLTQGLNLDLLHYWQILYHLSPQRNLILTCTLH